MSTEIWKDVVRYEGFYQVSDLGNVKSLARVVVSGKNGKTRKIKERILKFGKVGCGYFQVSLYKNENRKTLHVHRLVLTAFVGECPENMECCHSNGIRTDNRLSNLRWDSKSNNQKDRIKHGTYQRGDKNPNVKLTDVKILKIRRLYATGGIYQKELAKMFGVTQPQISDIILRKRWTHI